jgi:peroxiredoxin
VPEPPNSDDSAGHCIEKGSGLCYRWTGKSKWKFQLSFPRKGETEISSLNQLKKYGADLEDASGENHHMLPVPAVFLAGTNGVIQFTYANPDYRVRLHPDLLLAAARLARR